MVLLMGAHDEYVIGERLCWGNDYEMRPWHVPIDGGFGKIGAGAGTQESRYRAYQRRR